MTRHAQAYLDQDLSFYYFMLVLLTCLSLLLPTDANAGSATTMPTDSSSVQRFTQDAQSKRGIQYTNQNTVPSWWTVQCPGSDQFVKGAGEDTFEMSFTYTSDYDEVVAYSLTGANTTRNYQDYPVMQRLKCVKMEPNLQWMAAP